MNDSTVPARWLKINVAYDGANFAGWQVQPALRTVQGELEAAWYRVTGENVLTTASGRTDAGVHAVGQVVGLRTESPLSTNRLQLALNAHLPDDVVVTQIAIAPRGFHATHDALRKTYRYQIHAGNRRPVTGRDRVWHVRKSLDILPMQQAALLLCGRRDFACFESSGSDRDSTIRTVVACDAIRRDDARIDIEVTGDGFLYNMVRTIAGTLVEVGRGVRPVGWVGEVLASCDRKRAGQTAPAHGLVLLAVAYD